MRKLSFIIVLVALVPLSCSDSFLEVQPKGLLSVATLSNKIGVEYLLTGAYSLLDGWNGTGTSWHSAPDNHVYGSIAADDAYKGTTSGDQPDMTFIETHNILPDNGYFRGKWRLVYDGVARANDVLQLLPKATDVTPADATIITAEARFLRAHYHFEAKKMFNNVPYIDEVGYDPLDPNSTKKDNNTDIWPKIEADFDFAYKNLDQAGGPRNGQRGRATRWAAAAYLAKVYIFQKKFALAKPLLEAVIASGRYSLVPRYHDNYRASTKNNAESIFEIQFSVNDGTTGGQNGNNGATLNYPYAGPATCCGFFQPAQNLVNAFKTDANGLPLFDTFNATDFKNDRGVESNAAYTPDVTTPVDSRLDWTVGRRGVPYLDWGIHPGKNWVREQAYGGPYSPIKHMHYLAERGTLSSSVGSGRQNANNYRLIRYAHVLLWLAECEIEEGTPASLERARVLINQVRARAANPAGFVRLPNGNPAANYVVGTYAAAVAPFDNQANARRAVQFENRLEFAMEGHRRFDLVRWGIAKQTLDAYWAVEGNKQSYLKGVTFTAGKHEYFPIPVQEILNSSIGGQATLKQNPGY
jgi:starch-binding outer membrane protein, SusD/RagB family